VSRAITRDQSARGKSLASVHRTRNRTAMATSLRPLPSALLCVSPRHAVVGRAHGNILSSIRSKSTRAPSTARDSLPWSEYLAIRRGKRKWEIVCL
jgi:hypothetical protein